MCRCWEEPWPISTPPRQAESLGKKVAIIGGGPAGMNAAWQLALGGVEAHIFEQRYQIGGKLAQVIPWERASWPPQRSLIG